MFRKHYFFSLLLLGLMLIGQENCAAQNLVLNPGFDQLDTLWCQGPTWHVRHWDRGNNATPDIWSMKYETNCMVGPLWMQRLGQFPRSDSNFMGFITDDPTTHSWAEYLTGNFSPALVPGKVYTLTMYIRNGNFPFTGSDFITKNLGVFFTKSNSNWPLPFRLEKDPHVWDGRYITERKWYLIKKSFVADSAYNFLTIGGFANVESFRRYPKKDNGGSHYTYCLIDDVAVYASSETIIGDSAICYGESTILKTVDRTNVRWVNSNHPSEILGLGLSYVARPLETTTYFCISDQDTQSITVVVMPKIEFSLGDDIYCFEDSVVISPSPSFEYIMWEDGSINPMRTIKKAGLYWVTVTDLTCSYTDTILVAERDCEMETFLPNVFSPNGDGVNDYFIRSDENLLAEMQIEIYNRWGSLVYNDNTIHPRWDGRFNGNDCAEGTYYYTAIVEYVNGKKYSMKGTITLFR